MLELSLIKDLLKKDEYLKYRKYINIKVSDTDLEFIYQCLDNLMETYDRDITFDEFKIYTIQRYPHLQEVIHTIENIDIKDDFIQDTIDTIITRAVAREIALTAISVSEGRQSISELEEQIKLINDKPKVDSEDVFISDDLDTLYSETLQQVGLRWRLPELNKMLGSLRKGDFGFIFARIETGKTTFLASEISFMAEQLNEESGPILWINNEEQGSKVKIRVIQASLGIELPVLFNNRPKHTQDFRVKTKGKILILDDAQTNKRRIEDLCQRHKPSLVVIDQIDKIKGFSGDRNDLKLGSIYVWARELAKVYCPFIGVCQADVSAEGQKWLTSSHIAESKTAKAAEADFILGIGKVSDINYEFVRFLHACKNKLQGDIDTDPTLRHGRLECLIQPEIARYRSL